MASIKCKACGRRYSYHVSDLCPHCGAYNRPSSRMRVDFDKDGNAELLHEQAFLQQSKAGQQRQKACYERKECHEGVARRVRFGGQGGQKEKPQSKDWVERIKAFYTDKDGESKDGAKVLTAIAVFVLYLILSAVFR